MDRKKDFLGFKCPRSSLKGAKRGQNKWQKRKQILYQQGEVTEQIKALQIELELSALSQGFVFWGRIRVVSGKQKPTLAYLLFWQTETHLKIHFCCCCCCLNVELSFGFCLFNQSLGLGHCHHFRDCCFEANNFLISPKNRMFRSITAIPQFLVPISALISILLL